MNDNTEISAHQIRVYQALTPGQWVTSRQIADNAKVAPRTARAHVAKLVKLGVADHVASFPAHLYRLNPDLAQCNPGYLDRLTRAAAALGIPLPS